MTVPAIRKSVVVHATCEKAFEVFTDGFGRWWPLVTHHTGPEPAVDVVVEPRAGGRWFERAASGLETMWGHVRVWEPPRRLVLGWHLNADYEYEADPARSSEIEVTFSDDGDGRTRVELEHRGLEAFGDRAPRQREKMDEGWGVVFDGYAAHVG